MPTMEQLAQLATDIYGTEIGAYEDVEELSWDEEDVSAFLSASSSSSYFNIWSGEEIKNTKGSHAYNYTFNRTYTRLYDNCYGRAYCKDAIAVCVKN